MKLSLRYPHGEKVDAWWRAVAFWFFIISAVTWVAFIVCSLATPAQARDVVECSDHRGPDPRWWSWRDVDGRRCWYVGPPNKPKSELYWRVHESPLRGAQVQRTAQSMPAAKAEVQPVAPSVLVESPTEPYSSEDLKARAMTNLVLLGQERLREHAAEPWPEPVAERPMLAKPLPAAPHIKVQEQMPIWLIALIFITIAGIAFVLPLVPRRTLWPTNTRK